MKMKVSSHRFTSIIIQILIFHIVFLSFVIALEDNHEVRNGVTIQTCAKVTDYRRSYLFSLGESLQPKIDISFHYTANNEDPVEKANLEKFKKSYVEVTVLPSKILDTVRLEPKPVYKICDESSLKKKMCSFASKKDLADRVSLSEAIEKKLIKDPILKQRLKLETQEVDTNNESQVIGASTSIELNETEIYCIVMTLYLRDDIKPEDSENLVLGAKIGWQQSYGQLLISDYHYLYITGLMSMTYTVTSLLYWYYLFVYKVKRDKSNATSLKFNSRSRSLQIQLKIMTYLILQSLIYVCLMIYYYRLNKLGYIHNDFITALINFLSLSLETFVTIWVVYNFMLFSSGYIILTSNMKNNFKRLNLVKSLTVLLLFSFLSFDLQNSTLYSVLNARGESLMGNLIFVELIIISITCLYWGLNTYKSLKQIQFKSHNQIVLINKLLKTVSLILIPIILSLFLRDIISRDFINLKFEAVATLVSYSYVFNFLITLAIAFIWKDCSIEQNEIYFK